MKNCWGLGTILLVLMCLASTAAFADVVVIANKNNFRFHIEYAVSSSVLLKNRVEVVNRKVGETYEGSG